MSVFSCSVASYDTRPHASARKGFKDAFKDVRQAAVLPHCSRCLSPCLLMPAQRKAGQISVCDL